MRTCIEITDHLIRFCQIDQERIVRLERWPRPASLGPVACLERAPLPDRLGPVTVLVDDAGLSTRTVQVPFGSDSRISKAIQLDVRTTIGEEADQCLIDWQPGITVEGGDQPLMVLVARRQLIGGLQRVLRRFGGSLQHLSTPAVGLAAATTGQDELLVSLEHAHCQLAWLQQGQLRMARRAAPGLDLLVSAVQELRGLDAEAAVDLLGAVNQAMPADLRQAIREVSNRLASLITQHLHYLADHFDAKPQRLLVASALGALPGLLTVLRERLEMPVAPINPFVEVRGPVTLLDDQAELPSPWSTLVSACRQQQWCLDACRPWAQERRRYWLGPGLLRLAAMVVLVVAVFSLANLWRQSAYVHRQAQRLGDDDHGLLSGIGSIQTRLRADQQRQQQQQARLRDLAGHHLPDRVSRECLNLIARIQDPDRCPVRLDALRVQADEADLVVVEFSGTVPTDRPQGAGALLASFERQLQAGYGAALLALEPIPVAALSPQGHAFAYRLRIQDGRAGKASP